MKKAICSVVAAASLGVLSLTVMSTVAFAQSGVHGRRAGHVVVARPGYGGVVVRHSYRHDYRPHDHYYAVRYYDGDLAYAPGLLTLPFVGLAALLGGFYYPTYDAYSYPVYYPHVHHGGHYHAVVYHRRTNAARHVHVMARGA
jgi:hypothetical protein